MPRAYRCILHSENVFTYKGRPAGRMLNTAWKRVRERAGLPWLTVHGRRQTFGHRLRSIGVPEVGCKALLGHKDGDVTTRYCAPSLPRLLEHVEGICIPTGMIVLRVRQNSGKNAPLGRPHLTT